MTRRRRILTACIALIALWSASLLTPGRVSAAVHRNYILDTSTGALWMGAILLAVAWICRRRPAATSAGAAMSRKQFRNIPVLWAGFAVSLLIVFVFVESPGPVRSSYFGRLRDTSPGTAPTAADLVCQGVMYAGMAILFGWAAHAIVIVGLDILTGDRHARTRDAVTIDECANHLRAAGWSVGESCFKTEAGIIWQVDGVNGENRLLARAPTQTGVWRAACTDAFAKVASGSTWSASNTIC